MTYEVDLNREFGDRIISMKKDNFDIDLDKYYTIVMNSDGAKNTTLYQSYEDEIIL